MVDKLVKLQKIVTSGVARRGELICNWRVLSGVMAGALIGACLATASTSLAQEGKPPLTMASFGGAFRQNTGACRAY
jgi:hypothetical protein